jgi:hypothetical protein
MEMDMEMEEDDLDLDAADMTDGEKPKRIVTGIETRSGLRKKEYLETQDNGR